MGRSEDFNAGTELVTPKSAVGRVHHGNGKTITGHVYKGLRTGTEITFNDGSTGVENGSRIRVKTEEKQ